MAEAHPPCLCSLQIPCVVPPFTFFWLLLSNLQSDPFPTCRCMAVDGKRKSPYLLLQLLEGFLSQRTPAQLRPQPVHLCAELALPGQPGLSGRPCIKQKLRCLLDVLCHLKGGNDASNAQGLRMQPMPRSRCPKQLVPSASSQ